MDQELYQLYLKCFPNYPVTESVFCDVLKPEKAHMIREYREGTLVGFAMLHGNSIVLLCVDPLYRRQGIGSRMLEKAEQYIRMQNAEIIYLGRGRHYLLQGVPADDKETIAFLKKRGYAAVWNSTNMYLDLNGYKAERFQIPEGPADVTYRLAKLEDRESLLQAVQDANSKWLTVFENCRQPILVAAKGERVIGFEILSPAGGQFVKTGENVGAIGCVGVIHSERKQGVGLQMVRRGAEWLKEQGSTSIELRYVELVDWYGKIGFQPKYQQWMGEKVLKMEL